MPTKTSTTFIDNRRHVSLQSINPPGKYPNYTAGYTPSIVSMTSLRTDDGPVPSYRRLIAFGENATSGLSGHKVDYRFVPGFYAYGGKVQPNPLFSWDWSIALGNVSNSGPISPSVVGGIDTIAASVINEAKRKFIQRATSEISAFDGGTFLGELRETLQMIKRPAKSLRTGIDDYFRTIKRRRRGSPAQKRKILADSWLEYQFGWRPLVSDIKNASQALVNLQYRALPFTMVSATATADFDIPVPVQNLGAGRMAIFVSEKRFTKHVVVIRGVVNLNCRRGLAMSSQNLGFRWDSFVPTVWELIPYSFLVDYFTNIGDIIQSWSFASGNLKWASMTRVVSRNSEWTASDPSIPNPLVWAELMATPHTAYASTRRVQRDRAVASLIPSLEFSLPSRDSLKWLNIAALATSRRSMYPY